MGRISRAFLLLRAGHPDEADVQFRQAGPPEAWSWPVFFTAPGSVLAALVAIELDRADELRAALAALEAFRGEHVVGTGVSYCGPAELTLGLGALAQGRLDDAVADLESAVRRCDAAGAPAFLAEASHHLAAALAARGRTRRPGPRPPPRRRGRPAGPRPRDDRVTPPPRPSCCTASVRATGACPPARPRSRGSSPTA